MKTDKRDDAELLQNLDRFIVSNTRALQPVRVPTEKEERERSQSRQRDGLSKERKRLENQGTNAARYSGLSLSAEWWKPKKFEKLRPVLDVSNGNERQNLAGYPTRAVGHGTGHLGRHRSNPYRRRTRLHLRLIRRIRLHGPGELLTLRIRFEGERTEKAPVNGPQRAKAVSPSQGDLLPTVQPGQPPQNPPKFVLPSFILSSSKIVFGIKYPIKNPFIVARGILSQPSLLHRPCFHRHR